MVSSTLRGDRPAGAGELHQDLASLRIDRSRRRRGGWLVKLIIVLLVLAAIGGGGAAGYWYFQDRLTPALGVTTDTVRLMTQSQVKSLLTATGYLESRRQASIGAKVPGRIAELHVEEGLKVEQGALLAVLEHNDLDATLAVRKVAVEQAQAQLAEAKRTLTQRERDYGREQDVHKRGAGTASALETAETEYLTAQARVASMTAAVSAAQATVAEADEAIRNMHVYAPFAGTVISKDAEVGETIMPGGMGLASGRGSVATLADLNALEVDTDVKEDYLSRIQRGQPAEIVVDAVSAKRYRGRLREIIPMGDRTRGIVKVKVEVLDADAQLFPELGATVHFLPLNDEKSAGDTTPSTYVPQGAITRRGGKTRVWRIQGEQAFPVEVKTVGKVRDGLVAIRGELAGGETIIVEPPETLKSGTRVRPSPGNSSDN